MLSIYKASAGSGKTYTLAREYIRLLLSMREGNRAHAHILAVTFTKKATAEMKERILSELHVLSQSPADSPYLSYLRETTRLSEAEIGLRAKQLLYGILQDYTHFSVSTIDGFFQQIVRSFAREVGLPAMYNLTLDADEVIEQAVDDLIFAMNHQHSDDSLSTWISEFATDNIREGKRWNPEEDIQQMSHDLLTERLQQELQSIRPILTNKELLRAYKQTMDELIAAYDTAGLKGKRADKMTEEQLRIRRHYYTALIVRKHLNELGVLSDVAEQIRLTNQQQRRLPISDVNILLHTIIDHSDAPFIYEKIGARLRHYMIDEFQDTSTLQWENFRPLVSEANASGQDNLIVGDTKQSIYRWRNSDWHLLEGVEHEIRPSELPTMKMNFRSSHIVVDANNMLFERYAQYVANQLDAETSVRYGDTIRQAYSTLRQQAKHQDMPGCYQLQFYDVPKAADAEQLALAEMLPILADVRRRGIPMSHVAVLVRKGSQAQRAAAFLMENGYEVQSAEGLLVASHPAVQLLTILLSLSVTPSNDLLTSRMRLIWASLLVPDSEQALALAMSHDALFSEQETACIAAAHQLPLYDQVQALIDGLQLHTWESAPVYLTTFLDIVYQYAESQIADVAAFLRYWERRATTAAVPSAPTSTAVQIMTIHKSKGLEFDVVLLPFLSDSVAASQKDSSKILWCHPSEAPFSELPLLPVQFVKELKNTIFADDYADELCNLYMDNLNVAYVAFTRAKRELYAFAQMVQQTSKGADSIKNVGNLLSVLLRDDLDEHLCYRSCSEQLPQHVADEHTQENVCHSTYHSVPIGERLHLRTHTRQDQELSLQDFGTLMHDLLALIATPDDQQKAILDMQRAGRIRLEDMQQVHDAMTRFWALVAPYDWFTPRYTILREQDILATTGNTYRPDRIMLDGRRAIVIDYKFGHEHRRTYQEQVRNYMTLLAEMGYEVEGYLVYVTLEKIDRI